LKNKGFTLIELIVVIVIMSVLIGIIGLSVSSVSSARTTQCATSVNLLISKCRADSLSRSGTVYLTISRDGNGDIACEHSVGKIVTTDTFNGKSISVSYTTKNSGVETTTVLADQKLTLSFSRSTGGLNPQSDGSYCTSIIFTGGGTKTITLYPLTGSHKIV